MRILVVHEVEFIRKVVFEWQEFPEMLAGLGHEVSVVDYDSESGWGDVLKWGAGPKPTQAAFRLDATRTVDLYRMIGPPPAVARRTYAALSSFTLMRRVFDAVRPEVVLLYAVPTCGPAVISAARSSGVPVVFRSIDALNHLVPRAVSFGVHLLERRVYPKCEKILIANPVLRGYIAQMSGGKAETELLLSPVDSNRFRPDEEWRRRMRESLGIPDGSPVAVFVGSLFHFTGMDEVLRLWSRAVDAVPEARLLVVGGGPDESRLRTIAEASPVAESIHFTGMRPYEDVPRLISAGDVGICPFRMAPVARNANPIKIMQYLACGLPCVSTPLDGTVAVLPETVSGVVYEHPGERFVERVVALLRSSSEREQLGGRGREWVASHHSFPQLVRRLSDSLESVARTGR